MVGSSDAGATKGNRRFRLGNPVNALIGLLVAYRIVYHSVYLRDVPFAVATFSDGRQYELAALDILAHPPLGTAPFYLQGLYAYFMAVPMMIRPWPAVALLAQLALSGLTAWVLWRVARRVMGTSDARWMMVVLLAYPMLGFYENKFLTASLAVSVVVLLLWAIVRLGSEARPGRLVVVGVALGLAALARPNYVLLVPFVAWAIWEACGRERPRAGRAALWVTLGLALSLGPMLTRNVVVTGSATVFPAHGGGTSFYIGNNRQANGVWNDASGLLSGDVSQERGELLERLGVESTGDDAEQIEAIGRVLYGRAFDEIAEEPGRWIRLELKKAWLLTGNDELTQDYDLHGEIAMIPFAHRVGIPFCVLLVIGGFGLGLLVRRARVEPEVRPWVAMLVGVVLAVVAANILYFTSSQHRLPLVVSLVVGFVPGARWILKALRRRRFIVPALLAIAIGLCLIPRSKKREPSAVFFYNLSVAYIQIGQPQSAGWALDRAVDRRPDHPVILIERASFRRSRGSWSLAREDLETLEAMPGLPSWVRDRVNRERHLLLELTGER